MANDRITMIKLKRMLQLLDAGKSMNEICRELRVMFQFVCPKRDPHFKDEPKLSVLFHTMINTNHIFIKSVIGAC